MNIQITNVRKVENSLSDFSSFLGELKTTVVSGTNFDKLHFDQP